MKYMTKILSKYDAMRGKSKEDWHDPFWDIIVITAADDTQKRAFELQIAEKKRLKELPLFDGFHVIEDPVGPKIGAGGSTLLVLTKLWELYQTSLFQMRVLLIHAGGSSQRIPSHSCLGKLFALLPFGNPPYQILDMKLAMYLPFLERMTSGIFLCACDDIITFDLDQNPHWSFENDGFTALAHPSMLNIATTHGVYVLSPDLTECTRVLQKPSLALLQQCGAIIEDSDGSQFAYTDSSYFFDHNISQKFLILAKELQPFNCEFDAYGDFLQPLGTQPSEEYLESNCELRTIRRKLYDALKGSKLNVAVLKNSTFYHLGTTAEYLYNLTACKELLGDLGVRKNNFLCSSQESETIIGTIMQSYIDKRSIIGENSVVEHCDFQVPIAIENGILSNCQLIYTIGDTDLVNIPSGTLFYTSSVSIENCNQYVTVAFSITDNIKQSYDISKCGKLTYMGVKLQEMARCASDLFRASDQRCSLWNACLFTPCSTRNDAFRATLHFVQKLKIYDDTVMRLSMAHVFQLKDIEDNLHFHGSIRKKLHEK